MESISSYLQLFFNWNNYSFIRILRIDKVITSRGKIENTGSIKLIKSNMDGNILDIFFEEGQKVKKDALLIKFEDEIYHYQEEIF